MSCINKSRLSRVSRWHTSPGLSLHNIKCPLLVTLTFMVQSSRHHNIKEMFLFTLLFYVQYIAGIVLNEIRLFLRDIILVLFMNDAPSLSRICKILSLCFLFIVRRVYLKQIQKIKWNSCLKVKWVGIFSLFKYSFRHRYLQSNVTQKLYIVWFITLIEMHFITISIITPIK